MFADFFLGRENLVPPASCLLLYITLGAKLLVQLLILKTS